MGNIDIWAFLIMSLRVTYHCSYRGVPRQTSYTRQSIHSSIGLSFQYYFLLNRLTYGAKVSKVSRNKIRIFRYVVEKVCTLVCVVYFGKATVLTLCVIEL